MGTWLLTPFNFSPTCTASKLLYWSMMHWARSL
jgi:hypothetical protein